MVIADCSLTSKPLSLTNRVDLSIIIISEKLYVVRHCLLALPTLLVLSGTLWMLTKLYQSIAVLL